MTSTASTILRLELMGDGDQPGNWGDTTNTNLGTLLEGAIAGVSNVSVTASPQALSAVNYATDQSRMAILILTTTTAANFTIYTPPVSKTYIIYNSTAYAATIGNATAPNGVTTTGGATVTIAAGEKVAVFSDGTNFYGTIPADTVPATRGGTGLTAPGTSGNVLTSNGTVWTSATPSIQTPTGALLMWPTATAPTGWLLCDGSSYSTTTYASLFAVLAYVYGGSGANFNVPDFRDRMPIGAGTTYLANASGGSTTTTIGLANLPPHDHSITDPGHVHSVQYYYVGAVNPGLPSSGETTPSVSVNTASATTGITKTNTTQGNGSAFSNTAMTTISPYRGVYFIIKT